MNFKATLSLLQITLLICLGQSIVAMEKEIDIFQAIELSDLRTIKILLSQKVDINSITENELTPLHVAALSANPKTVKLLLSNGANINCVDDLKRTPLHCAAWEGCLSVSIELIEKKADINCKNTEGRTPLHFAANKGHSSIVQLLLKYGAEIDRKDNNGWTPLHFAVWCGYDNEEVIKKLLNKGADINCLNNEGKTAGNLAQEINNNLVMELIPKKEKEKPVVSNKIFLGSSKKNIVPGYSEALVRQHDRLKKLKKQH